MKKIIKVFRQNKGISAISMGIAITIMLIISSILIYNAKTGINISNVNKMYTDINNLDEKISAYYAEFGEIPIVRNSNEKIEYPIGNLSFLEQVKNPNDNEKYYIIDLNAIDNLTLNYGRDYYTIADHLSVSDEKDVYIINEQTHTIYYVKGVKVDGNIYYRTEEQYSKLDIFKSIILRPNNTGWTNQDVIVKVNYGVDLTNRKAGIGSANIENATSVTVSENATVYAEGTDLDGNIVTSNYIVNNIDKELPTVSLGQNGGDISIESGQTTATISTTITATDTGGSELNILQYAWGNSGTQEPTSWSEFTNNTTIEKTDATAGSWYLWTKVLDNAGNRAENIKVSNVFNVTSGVVDRLIGQNKTIDGSTTGTYNNPIIPIGFKAINENGAEWGTTNGWTKGLVIEDITGDSQTNGSQFVWIPVRYYSNFRTIEGYYSGQIDTLVTDGTAVECGAQEGVSGLTGIPKEAQEMYASVKKNGGFYVARYEAGISPNMPQAKPTSDTTDIYADGSYKPVSKQNAFVWNYIDWGGNGNTDVASDGYAGDETANGAVKVARSMYSENSAVVSTLCYSVQWDAIMYYLDDWYIEEAGDCESIVADATGLGNEFDSDASNNPARTGDTNYNLYMINNIVDIAGNVNEFTMEAYDTTSRISRGGYFGHYGSNWPASMRSWGMGATDMTGFRVTLYLNN